MTPLSPRARLYDPRQVAPFLLLASALMATGCVNPPADESVGSSTEEVVYGDDDRLDYHEAPSEWQTLTRQSIVAMISSSRFSGPDPDYDLSTGSTLTEDVRDYFCGDSLCGGQLFTDHPTAASCSGTLIADDLVLTAGHCIDAAEYTRCDDPFFDPCYPPDFDPCAAFSWVFDYYYAAPGALETVTASDVYDCAEIVTFQNDGSLDFGIIRLDRPVTGGRLPAAIREGAVAIAEGTSLTIVGFGSGIPAKIDSGGVVLNNRASFLDYFSASVDAFGGNSGSGVFTADGELAGILVRGATDYVDTGSCCEVNTVPVPPIGTAAGEDITYSFNAIEALCATAEGDGRDLCAGWCASCTGVSDCPDGWGCRTDDATPGVSWCAPGCATDDDCRDDHSCAGTGYCIPERHLGCEDGDVWTVNSCNAPLALVEECPEEDCFGGVCGGESTGNPKSRGCEAAGPPVAEPGYLALLLIASLALFTRRRRLA